MTTTSAPTTPTTSADVEQVSIATSTPAGLGDEAGRGSVYDPALLAAGRLVHVHPTSKGIYLLAYANSLTAAMVSANAPGVFTASTAQPRPTFWWARPGGGRVIGAIDRNGTPGQMYPAQPTYRLIGGSSTPDMAYYLGTVTDVPMVTGYRTGQGTTDYVTSNWLVNSVPVDPATNLALEEVVWNRALMVVGQAMYVVGSRASDGALFLRKDSLDNTSRQYLSDKGWTSIEGYLRPMRKADGTLLTSVGPVSMVGTRDSWIVSVVTASGSNFVGRFFQARHPLSGWNELPQTVLLATSTTGVYFQTGVHPNPDAPALVGSVSSGIPYTFTVDETNARRTYWGVFPVPRRRL